MTTAAIERLRPEREAPYGRYVLASLGLMAIATANGVTRERTYGRAMNEDVAHWISLVPMVGFFALYVNGLARRWPLPSRQSAVVVGGAWAAIAAGFELGVGHYVDGRSWSDLLRKYNLAAGGSGAIVLAVTAALPSVVRAWRRRR